MSFGFHSPAQLGHALSLLADGDAKVISGGTDVFPSERPGHRPQRYIDLTRIAGLKGVVRGAEATIIGASTTWTGIAGADLPRIFDGLKAAAREVGSLQIQNAGTIGGNLCNASPAADGVPPLLALDASVELTSAARGVRRLPLAEFILGVRRTALAPDELLTAVVVPHAPEGARSSFEKLGARRSMVISIVMTSAVIGCDAAGRITMARVAVGACSPVARRLPALEAALIGCRPSEVRVAPEHLAPLAPITDVRGTAGFRFGIAAEQCRRAIRKAVGDEQAA